MRLIKHGYDAVRACSIALDMCTDTVSRFYHNQKDFFVGDLKAMPLNTLENGAIMYKHS